jgi:hypothetical protein
MQAPMKALMIAPSIPPPIRIPIAGSSHPATTAPTIPRMISPMSPNPAFHYLASKPARNGSDDEPNYKGFDCHGMLLKIRPNDLCSRNDSIQHTYS